MAGSQRTVTRGMLLLVLVATAARVIEAFNGLKPAVCERQQCGAVKFRPSSYIGAAYVKSNRDFPWMVQVKTGDLYSCAGVIVSPHWVLTGAYCGADGLAETTISVIDVTSDSPLLELKVDRVEKQPRCSPNVEPAFSLLHTAVPLPFSDSVSPVCAPDDTSLAPVRPGADLIFVGWGAPNAEPGVYHPLRLKWARLRAIDVSECKAKYSDLPGLAQSFDDSTFCTQFLEKNDEFSCGAGPVDYGGVFMDRIYNGLHEKWRMLGTKVAAFRCGEPEFPDINAALGPVMRWFRSVVDDALS